MAESIKARGETAVASKSRAASRQCPISQKSNFNEGHWYSLASKESTRRMKGVAISSADQKAVSLPWHLFQHRAMHKLYNTCCRGGHKICKRVDPCGASAAIARCSYYGAKSAMLVSEETGRPEIMRMARASSHEKWRSDATRPRGCFGLRRAEACRSRSPAVAMSPKGFCGSRCRQCSRRANLTIKAAAASRAA